MVDVDDWTSAPRTQPVPASSPRRTESPAMIERRRTGFNRYRWECDVPACPYSGSTDTFSRASLALQWHVEEKHPGHASAVASSPQ